MTTQNILSPALINSLEIAKVSLQQFVLDTTFNDQIKIAFGQNIKASSLNEIQKAFAKGDFSGLPQIEIRNADEINGANGAFSADTGKIYLAQEFLNFNANNPEAIVNVLIEEIGHYVDSQINTTDTIGDEGAIFSALVRGQTLTTQELTDFRGENDHATITLDGVTISIEQQNYFNLPGDITGSDSPDIFQVMSKINTGPGIVTKLYGKGGNDIFNVQFEISNGTVGLDFNAGNLKRLAEMLVEPDWTVNNLRYAADTTAALASAAVDYAGAGAKGFSWVPGVVTVTEVAQTSAQLTIELGNIAAQAGFDYLEYQRSLDDIDDFFNDQNNQDWGSVDVTLTRSIIEIRDFEVGVDTIILPMLPDNWSYAIDSIGTFSDTQKTYVQLKYSDGSNSPGGFLRIGFDNVIGPQIGLGQEKALINALLLKTSEGWTIGTTNTQEHAHAGNNWIGTPAGDQVYIAPFNVNRSGTISLSGGRGDDVIGGRNGNDDIDAGPDNDFIQPGTGNDTIDGGQGYDLVSYANLSDGIILTVSGTSTTFRGIEGIYGTDYSDKINFSSAPAPLDNLPIYVSAGNGSDTLMGSAYNDVLDPGYDSMSKDTVNGGSGDDVLVANYTDKLDGPVILMGGNIHNAIDMEVPLVTAANIERYDIVGTRNNDQLYGGAGRDKLYGDAGNDKLKGEDGNDYLAGQEGVDSLYGGNGDDIINPGYNWGAVDMVDGGAGKDILEIDYSEKNDGQGIIRMGNHIYNSPNMTSPLVTVTNIECFNLIGTIYNDQLSGSNLADTLNGWNGNDTLIGGAGNDTLIGGNGNDIYVVNSTTNTITENLNQGIDCVESTVSYTLTDNVEKLILMGTSAINGTGNALNNTITGNSANNTLNGVSGNDSLIGGDGNDTYVVDSTTDTITESLNQGTDLVKSTVSYTLSNNVEQLTLMGTSAIDGTGNALNNLITGNSANNVLNGAGGIDTLIGGDGNDTYVVEPFETITESLNQGTDLVKSIFSYTLGNNVENLTLMPSVLNVDGTGNALNNLITGTNTSNILNGGGGDDTLNPGVYNFGQVDTVDGGSNTDTLVVDYSDGAGIHFGRLGTNHIYNATDGKIIVNTVNTERFNITGSQYPDIFEARFGNNIFNGGAGNDRLIGGNGEDTLNPGYNLGSVDTVEGGFGADTLVVDYTSKSDGAGIHFGNAGTSHIFNRNGGKIIVNTVNMDHYHITGSQYADVFEGGYTHDMFNGGAGNDSLLGSFGDDTLNPGYNVGSVDTVNGGDQTDTLVVDYTSKSDGAGIYFGFNGIDQITNRVNGQITVYTVNTDRFNITGSQYADIFEGRGDNDMFNGGAGNDDLRGGAGNDSLLGGFGDDTLNPGYNAGSVDTIDGGHNTDTLVVDYTNKTDGFGIHFGHLGTNHIYERNGGQIIVNTVNTDRFYITGSQYADVFEGRGDNDMFNGGSGNDSLIGGAGNDTLTGGTGLDSFRFNSTSEKMDRITDFSVADDTIQVSGSGFGGGLATGTLPSTRFTIGSSATNSAHRFFYNSSNGGLFFDVDGNGATAAVQFATLNTGLALTNADIIVI